MKPALTTSGNTRTASAFDLHLAAAGFCATSCCRARRESLVKSSADAVRVPSNAAMASIKPGAYFQDRKSTRLNSSHITISYAVFCLKKKRERNYDKAQNEQNRRAESAAKTRSRVVLPVPD